MATLESKLAPPLPISTPFTFNVVPSNVKVLDPEATLDAFLKIT
jgi:hypothetical protein